MRNASIITALLFAVMASGCKDPAAPAPRASVGTAVDEASDEPLSRTESSRSYAFSGDGSRIDFAASKVTLSHEGGFKEFSGTFEVPGGDVEKATVAVEIDLDSVWSDNEKLTGHLRSPDFFDTEKFAKATFMSTGIDRSDDGTYVVTGNLDLHGVRKSISFPARITIAGEGFEAAAEFSLDRKSFGIVYPGMPDDLIKDEVVIEIEVSGSAG